MMTRQVKPTPRDGRIPLSWSQERLWFLSQFETGNSAHDHFLIRAFKLHGPLDVSVLSKSIDEVVFRHEILRTTFVLMDDQPTQVIAAEMKLWLPVVELEDLSSNQREEEARERILNEVKKPFNLMRGPLFRIQLLRFSPEEHVFILTMHRIIADPWALEIFTREVSILYEALSSDTPSPLQELPIQFADFSQWQRNWLQDGQVETDLQYWRRQLAGRLSILQLPADHTRSLPDTDPSSSCSLSLREATIDALKGLSNQEGVSLQATLLAAFQTLLYRLTGDEDIVVGLPIDSRKQSEAQGLIGPFVNSLVLRTNLSTVLSFKDLIGDVAEVISSARSHDQVPFEMLVEELQPERDLGHAPLYQAGFRMTEVEEYQLQFLGLRTEILADHTPLSGLDIAVHFIESGDEIQLTLTYRTDRYAQSRMDEILNQFEHLLDQVAEEPDQSLGAYSLVSPSALSLLPDPHATLSEPRHEPITTFIPSWVDHGTDHPAIYKDGQIWTYADLALSSLAIADALSFLDVEIGDIVAVTGKRSFGMIASMIGVLLSGGVLLNIDPNLPNQRQHHMLEEAKTKYLLYAGNAHPYDDTIGESVIPIYVDPDLGQIIDPNFSAPSTEYDLPGLSPEDAAYLFFTSGSTGVPKGVVGSHKGLSHFLNWQRQTFDIGPSDRSAQLTGLSFDVVLRDIFTPLTSGATLCLPSEDDILDPSKILPWMESEKITMLHTVPSIAQSWLADVPEGVSLRSLKRIFFAGEPLSEMLVRRWKDAFPESGEIINLYGPTETTLAKCFFRVPSDPVPGIQPIGSPLPETQALVLKDDYQRCGIGETGQIVLRTPFRSLGYLNASEENRRRFIKNPFRDDDRDLIYLTGDRGRYRPDGTLEILGRIDHQIKLRGIRIELGEIEELLRQHPQVREAVATVRQDASDEKRLVAYITSKVESSNLPNDLYHHMKMKVPDAMVPSAFVVLEKLPLSPNGKVDRQALPEPDWISPIRERPYAAPRTPVEEGLAVIMAQTLGLDRVSIHDNFFELGGHSLVAAQVIARARRSFEVELPIRSLFDAPTVVELAEFVEKQQKVAGEAADIKPSPRDQRIPLSHFQEPLWFIDKLEPGNPAYNLSLAFRLSGSLHQDALERSLNEIVRRHESLRTNFSVEDDQPFQVVSPDRKVVLEIIDLIKLSQSQREVQIQQLIDEEAKRSFDLEKDPLLRAKLLRLAEDDHVLNVTLHHLISDGWSQGILLRELSRLYKAYSEGKDSPLHELSIQYPDFAVWHRRWVQEYELDSQLRYWKEQLGSNPPAVELPADKVRPAIQTYRGAKKFLTVPADTYKELKDLSQRQRCTLFMTVLAIFNALLHRYTSQEDIAIGTPIANRNRPEIEDLIGLFLNMLVFRTDLSGNPTFVELLARVREVTLAGFSHQDVPFNKLVEGLQPPRDMSRSPLFQILLEVSPKNVFNLDGLLITPLDVDNHSAQFDLSLRLADSGEGLEGHFEYNTDLFEDSTIDRLADHFQRLIRAVVSNPDMRVSELPLLSEREMNQLVVEWNDTRVDYQNQQYIHQLFETQVERTPDAVALSFENDSMTYSELNSRANQLAHYLQALGVGPEVLVAVFMERSFEMVIALYAILKAGGAYVPLDPEYPSDRIEFMMHDTQVPVLLTQARLVARLPGHEAKVISLDVDWEMISQQSNANPTSNVTGENLAYVIYTSGSTGKPKGVMNHHRGILNRLLWMQDEYQLNASDRVLQKTPFSFDVSVWEFFWPLMSGARLVVARPGGHMDSAYLVQLIVEHGITTLHFVPSMLQIFIEERDVEQCRSLKRVICSGEALPYDLQERFFQRLDAELHNLYGPTEAAVDVTYWRCRKDTNLRIVPIGRPIANTQLYILDVNMRPVPIGVPGELHLGGVQVARGYLNREELTAQKFIPDPFSDDPKSRLYKTGDLARYLLDGNVEFLGRLDFQIKLRGFRIELGEIEAILNQHPKVREVVVLAREDSPGDKRLVAYIVPAGQSEIHVSELREYLFKRLPDYMVPAAFVILQALPLNPNGKVDRRNLPSPHWESQSETDFVAPRKGLEKTIAGIWQELLQIRTVGIDDSFFELGGHSLLLVRAHQKILGFSDRDLSITDMFRYPTIRTLAQYLSRDEVAEESISTKEGVNRAQARRSAMAQRRQFRRNPQTRDKDE